MRSPVAAMRSVRVPFDEIVLSFVPKQGIRSLTQYFWCVLIEAPGSWLPSWGPKERKGFYLPNLPKKAKRGRFEEKKFVDLFGLWWARGAQYLWRNCQFSHKSVANKRLVVVL
jgi:hypothetical protein